MEWSVDLRRSWSLTGWWVVANGENIWMEMNAALEAVEKQTVRVGVDARAVQVVSVLQEAPLGVAVDASRPYSVVGDE